MGRSAAPGLGTGAGHIRLAVWDETALLTLRAESSSESNAVGTLPQGTSVVLLDRQGNIAQPEELDGGDALTETWFYVRGHDTVGNPVDGWAPDSRIRVRSTDDQGLPIGGTMRPKLGATADPLTSLYAESSDASEVVGTLESGTVVNIREQAILECGF